MSQPFMQVTSDRTSEFNEVMKRFKNDGVLVGIPQSESTRDPDDGIDTINNATLLALAEFGSPLNNTPARHPMETGIRLAQDQIAEEFKKCGQNVLKTGMSAMQRYYERAGTIAASSIKKVITQNIDMEPPAPATLRARKAKGFKGVKALIMTGQMRNAITYVLTGKW